MKRKIFIAILSVCLFTIASCNGPRLVVSTQLAAPTYVRPNAPGPNYMWIDGDWIVENGNYVWHEGHWDRPIGHHTWHQGYWQEKAGGWYWKKGKWH